MISPLESLCNTIEYLGGSDNILCAEVVLVHEGDWEDFAYECLPVGYSETQYEEFIDALYNPNYKLLQSALVWLKNNEDQWVAFPNVFQGLPLLQMQVDGPGNRIPRIPQTLMNNASFQQARTYLHECTDALRLESGAITAWHPIHKVFMTTYDTFSGEISAVPNGKELVRLSSQNEKDEYLKKVDGCSGN